MSEYRLHVLPMTDMVQIERVLYSLSKAPQETLSAEERDWMDWAEQALHAQHLRELGRIA